MKARNILSQSAFWQINKALASKVGLESSILLSELVSREGYFEGRDMLIEINGDGYFFCTSQQLTDVTTLSYRKQKRCIKTLEDAGMIKTFLRGVPAKVHFSICDNNIMQCVNTSISKTQNTVLAKRKNCSSRNAKTINNNKEIIIDNNNKEQYKEKAKAYFDDLEINDLFIEFLDLRKSLKAKNTDRAIKLILKKLKDYPVEVQKEMIEQSIMSSWKSIYPIKKQFQKEKPSLAKKYFPEMFDKEDPFKTNLKLENND